MEPRALLREALLVSGGVTLLCAVLSWLQPWVPLLRAHLYVVVAALFLYVPVWVLRRRGLTTLDVGLTTRPRLRATLFALGAMAVTFLPFAVGFHVWQGWMFDNRPHFSADAYLRWPQVWEGRPDPAARPAGVQLWVDFSELHLRWREQGPAPAELSLVSDGRVELLSERRTRARQPAPGELRATLRGEGHLRLRIKGGERLNVSLTRGGQPLPTSAVFLGAAGEHPDALPLTAERSVLWLLLLVASHLLLVALPEELFYRGYLQTTLDGFWKQRVRVLGVDLGPSVVVTSAIFALGHFLVDLRVARLAVFFPSLLFGWLRAATGSLAAPILYHAASNILSDLLTKGYVQ